MARTVVTAATHAPVVTAARTGVSAVAVAPVVPVVPVPRWRGSPRICLRARLRSYLTRSADSIATSKGTRVENGVTPTEAARNFLYARTDVRYDCRTSSILLGSM